MLLKTPFAVNKKIPELQKSARSPSSIPLRIFNEAERPLPAELHCATGADIDCDIEDARDMFDCEGQVEVQARGIPKTTPVAPELIQHLRSINSDGRTAQDS